MFEKFMKDLTSYMDCERLKKLNAILLTELRIYYSDLDRLKYLNMMVVIQTNFVFNNILI